jgi:hypothetical protein
VIKGMIFLLSGLGRIIFMVGFFIVVVSAVVVCRKIDLLNCLILWLSVL